MSNTVLRSLNYFERKGEPNEWTLDDLALRPVNLVVGRNATGKTRTMNVIWNFARLFVPEPRYRTGNCGYDLRFEADGKPYRYRLCIIDGRVESESVQVDGETLLERRPGNEGEIFIQTIGSMVGLRPPENELAAVARRDSLQHSFLEPLHEWALGVRHYTFGASLGQQQVAIIVKNGPEPDDRDADAVVGIFQKGVKQSSDFVAQICRDMAALGYHLDDVLICAPESIRIIKSSGPSEVVALGVRERNIGAIVDQVSMSQGMFRALSILIQVNYSQLTKRANCILIDDIGEGLDYERSTKLIEILQRKALESSFQLVMTTNDRFVMNAVPLEYWSVLQRDGGHVRVRNYENSRAIFEEFKETGLSNFSFLELDFINEARCEELVAHE